MEYKKHFLKIKPFFSCGRLELTVERGTESSYTTDFITVRNKHIKNDMDVIHSLKLICNRLSKRFDKEYKYEAFNNQVIFEFGDTPMELRRLKSKTLITIINNFFCNYK